MNQQTGQITRRPVATDGLSADSVYEDETGDLWLLTNSPVVGLVRYDRRADRLTSYPLAARAPRAGGVLASTTSGGSLNGMLAADGQNGLWVPSSEGLSYFDRRTERFTHRFQHEDANPHSLDSNAIFSVYQDRGGVLWVGTENAGLNVLNFRQQQFVRYMHRPADPQQCLAREGEGDPPGSRWRAVGGFVPSRPGPVESEVGPDSPLPVPATATRIRLVQERTSTASTEILRAFSGSAAVVVVWSGSTSALDASSTTGTTVAIRAA